YKRPYKIVGRDEIDAANLDANTSYLFPIAQNQFVNVNPDLSYAGLDNRVFYSEFTRLFFFEFLPGFELAYRSPRGQVKIFKYVGKPSAASSTAVKELAREAPLPSVSNALQPSAEPSVEASAAPAASTTASPAPSASPETST
ncbi:MAG: hypothetical protein QW343_03560, partial [Candidatus Norongarragalinales archaeon]